MISIHGKERMKKGRRERERGFMEIVARNVFKLAVITGAEQYKRKNKKGK